MKRYNFVLILLLTMVAFWLIITEDYSLANVGIAFFIGVFTLFIVQVFVLDSEIPDIKLSLLGKMSIYFVKVLVGIFISSYRVLKAVLKNQTNVDRVTVELPTEHGLLNALICNSITLTPGTITLEMNGNKVEVLVFNPELKSKETLQKDIESSYESMRDL